MASIGILGAGHIGRSFAAAAITAGHEVVIANSRGPESITNVISELGPSAHAATARDAAERGDFVVMAIPLNKLESVSGESLSGKIVLAACNYLPERDGRYPELDSGRLTVPGLIQAHLPGSRVARAFNHIAAADIIEDASPAGTPNRRALAYTADDREAGELAAQIYMQLGFDAVDAGGLGASWRLDVNQPAFVVRLNADELRASLAKAQPQTAS